MLGKLSLELGQLVLPCLNVELVLQHLLLSHRKPVALVLAGGADLERIWVSHLAFLLVVRIIRVAWLHCLFVGSQMHLAIEVELRQLGIVGGCHLND